MLFYQTLLYKNDGIFFTTFSCEMKKRLKTNIIIILVAAILAFALFLFTENPDRFSASIISLQDAQTMKENNRDIWYKNESQNLDVFVSDDLKDISNLTISIIYDENNTEIDIQKLVPQTNLISEVVSDEPWTLVLRFSDFSGFDYTNSLFEMPFSAHDSTSNALLSEAVAVLLDGNSQSLSIGLLNEKSDSYHGF